VRDSKAMKAAGFRFAGGAAALALVFGASGITLAQQDGGMQAIRDAAAQSRATEQVDRVVTLYREGLEQREEKRSTGIEEAWAELDEHIAAADEAQAAGETQKRDVELSESLRVLNDLDVLKGEAGRPALEADPRFDAVVSRAEQAAREAEARGDWILANELYVRLDALFEDEGPYEAETDRLLRRLSMIRLYAPERLWELRNERRVLGGDDELPPHNPFGDSFEEKLQPIRSSMIVRALQNAAYRHIEGADMGAMVADGLSAVELFAETSDLREVFPGLADGGDRRAFLSELRALRREIEDKRSVTSADLASTVDRMLRLNRRTIDVMPQALLHEFGNGSMDDLDRYTAMIWPDEVKRFERSTQGRFTGVGIQIEMDDLFNVKVVTPLPGSPAQRAGIGAGDIITKVNGRSIVGFTLDQAVEVITGPEGTTVDLTVERGEGDEKRELSFELERRPIDLPTVKGWRKTGPGDGEWDWFIDRNAGIGYIRITNFAENTTSHFDAAVREMRDAGLNGLVLDLRFNPGGLLDQAVNIANRWVGSGLIVKTEGSGGVVTQREFAGRVPDARSLEDVPTAVLINEGSASASEIVSGSIQAYAREGRIDAWVIGENTFGKGSVQNVFPLDARGRAMMKLTTNYYKLRDDKLIHRREDAENWGIQPDLEVEMLPDQIIDALTLRRDADIFELDEEGRIIEDAERPDPDDLIEEGIDLQLQRAVLALHEARAGVVVSSLDQTAGK